MDFYPLTSFTAGALEPLIAAKAPSPEFPKTYFQEAERILGEELQDSSNPWLLRLYAAAFELSSRHGMLGSLLWWPPPASLRRILRAESILGDCVRMETFIGERFPDARMLLNLAAVAWWRSLHVKARDAGACLNDRLLLGQRILRGLPVNDRNLAQKLDESDFRREIDDDLWPIVVGEMAVRVQGAQDHLKRMEWTAKDFSDGLGKVSVSAWKDLTDEVGKMSAARSTVEVLRPADPVAGGRREAFGDIPEFGISGYVLDHVGVGAVLPDEFGWWQDAFSRLSDARKAAIRHEGATLLMMHYAQAVARYGCIGGFLKRQQDHGAGVLRAYLRGYAMAFAAELEDVFDEDLGASDLVDGSCVLRLALSGPLWQFFSFDRMRETNGMDVPRGGRDNLYEEYNRVDLDVRGKED